MPCTTAVLRALGWTWPLLARGGTTTDAERKAEDAVKFHALDEDACMLCDAYGADKRSLFIDCFYAVDEVVPEALNIHDVGLERGRGYYLRICKSCRARLLGKLQEWRDECVARRGLAKDHDGGDDAWDEPERNIPVRINGAVQMLTEAEWRAWRTTTDAQRPSPESAPEAES